MSWVTAKLTRSIFLISPSSDFRTARTLHVCFGTVFIISRALTSVSFEFVWGMFANQIQFVLFFSVSRHSVAP